MNVLSARCLTLIALLAALSAALPARPHAAPDPVIAALQVTMRSRLLYRGPVTGVPDDRTVASIRALQLRLGVAADGVFGPQTRGRLAASSAPVLGRRLLTVGAKGYDVALLRVQLALHGFPSGRLTSAYTPRTARAVLRFQRWAGLPETAMAGPLTARALRAGIPVSPIRLAWPVTGAITSGYGFRGARFHAGVDLDAPLGTPVGSPGAGRVVWAGWRDGGWGYAVVVAHGAGVRSLVAHLSRVDVRVGQRVRTGEPLGLSGTTGASSGPHVHVEVRLRSAYVDPLSALPCSPVRWCPAS